MNNLLFYGDNLDILRNRIRDETVDLCYIDPPFNSKRNYFQIYTNVGKEDQAQAQAFVDMWTWDEQAILGYQDITTNYQGRYVRQTIELLRGLKAVLGEGSLLAYLVSIAQRVNEIQRVLKPTGSFYLHCDPTASHYLKLVLDSVFCSRGGEFVNDISWKRTTTKSDYRQGAINWPRIHDIIFYYVKDNKIKEVFHQPFVNYSDKYIKEFYKEVDQDGRKYTLDKLTAPGSGSRGHPLYELMGVIRHWVYGKEKMDELIKQGRIIQTKPGTVPRYKRYLDEVNGVAVGDLWVDIPPISAKAAERLGYPTQKPEALLERIIQASSNEGDTVLDAYCGCGTTVAVAQRLRRHWIGIDITYQSIAVILRRLEDSFGAAALETVNLDGIPRDMESARALANKKDDRVRKEFEKWAVLTYSKSRAAINAKKGADKGIDGVAYLVTGNDTTERVIFQVKSGSVNRGAIAALRGDMEREGAAIAILITLEEPTKPMRDEAVVAGLYHHHLLNRDYPRIQIVTIKEMLEGKQIDLPLSIEVLKSAGAVKTEEQHNLPLN